jgi:TP901 family phage tail tape measure protein
MATDLYTVEIQAKSTGVAAATAEMEKLGKQSSLASTAVKLFGAAAAGLSVGAIFQKITQDTIGFTKSISELSAITGATGKDLKFYEEQAALIGKTTTLSASQAADAFKLIASAKPDLLANKEALAAVTKEAVKLAEAAGIGLADAASTVGVSLNQFGAGAEEASRFVNVLAAGAKEGSSSITDTAQAMKNAGVAASLAGLSFEEANVGVQLLAKGGLFAAEAGTGFRQVLLKLENEADDRFKPSMVGLAGALENLAAENMSLTELTGLFGAEAMKSAAIMINGAGDARKLEAALTGTSTATEMAQTNFDNMTGDLLSLNSANEGLAITMGKMLEPIIRKVIQATTEFSRKVDDFVKSEKFNDVLRAMTIGAQTLAAILTGQILGTLAKTATGFALTASKAGLASTAVGILKAGLTLLGGPIGLTVTALTGLYFILSDIFGFDFDDFARYFKATFTVISGYVKTFTKSMADGFKAVFEYVTNLLNPVIEFYSKAFNTIWNTIKSFFTALTNGATIAINFFVDGFRNGFLNVRQFVETTKINIEAFYETMKVKAASFFDSEETTARKLATINSNKATSLQAVTDKYADMASKQVTTRNETGLLDTAFDVLNTTSGTISASFGTFIGEINSTAEAMKDGQTSTENYDAAIKSANSSVGVLKTQFQNTNTDLNTLGANFDLRTSEKGSFRVVTGAMEAMATTTGNVGAQMIDLEKNTNATSVAIAGEDGEGGLTLAQNTFRTAVENTQTAWATLIRETVETGKLDFGTFFDTVKSGFVTMVSEIAAQNITNAIFGQGGLSSFLTNISSGFGSIIQNIASGLGGIISSFVSQLTGLNIGGTAAASSAAGAAGGTAAGGGGLAAIGSSVAAGMAAAGQFVSGAMGTAVGTSATLVGPPTAAAAAGSGFTASLAAMGSKAVAFMTNPVTLAILAAFAVGKMLDKGGTPTSTVGMTMAKTAGMSDGNIFQTAAFESGFAPLGFKQNGTNAEAEQAIQPFRDLDMTLTAIAESLGYNVNLAGHTFNGYGVEGTGAGTVMGSFVEEGKVKGTPIESQMDRYASEWIHAVGVRNGLSAQAIRDVQGNGSFEEILANSQSVLRQYADNTAAASAAASNATSTNTQAAEAITTNSNNDSFNAATNNTNTLTLGNTLTTGQESNTITLTNPNSTSIGTNSPMATVEQYPMMGPTVDGKHQSGLGSVPYDGYIAELHAGERVQTRAQVAATDRMSSEMVGLRNNLNELMLVVAKAVTKTARIEDRWDKNGLPPVRA